MTNAFWSIDLNCDCPNCHAYVNLLADPDILNILEPLEHGTATSSGVNVICPECEHEFKVDLQY